MTTFSTFVDSFESDGRLFEGFVKWFLQHEPTWANQIEKVWLWEEYPDRWGPDCGIDLVFKHRNGEIWAVQAKCYGSDYYIKKDDINSFLSESNRPEIHQRLLIASTDHLGANARRTCEAQEKSVVLYLRNEFEQAGISYPKSFRALASAKRKKLPKPRPHQKEAITAAVTGFKTNDRGQLIMACGTGKTFVTLWIKEKLLAQSTLVLLPSLNLLAQTLREWAFAASTPYEALCVCSDQTVGKNTDEAIQSVLDVPYPVTTDVADVRAFLNQDGAKVVFSTYQSSDVIAEAQTDLSIDDFDLTIADEAHRCAGKAESIFSTVLHQEKIRSKKRLFATATQRIYKTNIKSQAEERGVEVLSMDDKAAFGKPLHTLSFGESISRGLLTDYQVVIVGVDDSMIAEWIKNRELVTTDTGVETDAESLAAQIALIKAMKDYDLTRLISFHSRIKRAEAFSADIKNMLSFVDEKNRPDGELWADFVSGAMPTDKRRTKLSQLKSLETADRGLLSNSRCLSEGVDVPSLDGVAFIDPRRSSIDIIQAVGRAIRLSENKKIGTIVLPVFIENGDDPQASIEASNFKPVWDVLIALKSHDDVLHRN